MIVDLFIPGVPVGQARPRARAFKPRADLPAIGSIYPAKDKTGWTELLHIEARRYRPPTPLLGPVAVIATFRFPRPKKHFRSNGSLRGDAPTYHLSRPDADNCVKKIFDVLTLEGYWRDDSQVCRMEIEKRYADEPGAAVRVSG